MAGESLSASLLTSNADQNVATPADTISFRFSRPPPTATGVLVSIRESVDFLDGSATIRDRPIGGFRGRIAGGRFIHERILGAPLPSISDPVVIRIASSTAPNSPHLFAHLPEPHRVNAHTLTLQVEGRVGGAQQVFRGKSVVHLQYAMAMVVPTPPATTDNSLNIVESWSRQWQRFNPSFRQCFGTRLTRLTRDARPADYDDWIGQMRAAAEYASRGSGVVAMATGHGDAGGWAFPDGGTAVAWCNLPPEDWHSPEAPHPYRYQLALMETELADGTGVGMPMGVTKVKLDALDRLADSLSGTGLRRIILHTCAAGDSAHFMQMLADRIRVPMIGHRTQIEYTGTAGSGNIAACPAGSNPERPRDERQWNVTRLGRVFRPGPPPRRFGP